MESDHAADAHATTDVLATIAAATNVANIAQASTAVIARSISGGVSWHIGLAVGSFLSDATPDRELVWMAGMASAIVGFLG